MLKFLKIISSVMLFLAFFLLLPVVFIAISLDTYYYLFRDTFVIFQKMIGGTLGEYNGFSYWWYIVYFIILFLAYKIMRRRIFFISITFWISLIVLPIIILNKPVTGLLDIPDSTFMLSGIDINHIPQLSKNQCEEREVLLNSLSGSLGLLMDYHEEKKWQELEERNPQYLPIIQYLHSTYSGESLKSEYNYDLNKIDTSDKQDQIVAGSFMLDNLVVMLPSEKRQEYQIIVTQGEKMRIQYHDAWVQALKGNNPNDDLISIFYSPQEQESISKLIENIDNININGFGYCIKESLNSSFANKMSPSMGNDIKIVKILGKYSTLLVGIGNSVEAYKVMSSLATYIKTFEKNTFSLVGAMVNIAMKQVYYNDLNLIQKMNFPKSFQQILVKRLISFDNNTMLLNGFRGDYYGISHLYKSETVDMRNIYLPIVFDGEETDNMLRNAISSIMNEVSQNQQKVEGKYENKGKRVELFDKDFGVSFQEGNFNIHNILGKMIVRAVLINEDFSTNKHSISMENYITRARINDIMRNTLLYSVGR